MHALDLLKDDHRTVKDLFEKVRSTESDEKKLELFAKIKEEIDVHTHIEEEIFYPAVKEAESLEDIVAEGVEEHHQADVLMREIEALSLGSDKLDPKLKVLMESVEHHIREEEEEMFPKVREEFSGAELEDLGKDLKQEKQKFKKSMGASAS